MEKIVYQRQIPAESTTLQNGETIVTREAYLQIEKLGFTDGNKEIQIAEALKYSYNGEYTIEDDGEPEPPPTTEQLVSDLEEQLAQSDETAITLYEAQEAQEAINSQQDEALMEIYEMIGE